MTVDLEAIARRGRCETASLRIALPLLEQGYTPPYLARYRRDELGDIDEASLWHLSHAVQSDLELQRRREELVQSWKTSELTDPALGKAVEKAASKRLLDRLARRVKSELGEKVDPSTRLAARILNPRKGDGDDIASIAGKVDGIEADQVEAAVAGLDNALAKRLCGDPRVINAAVRWLTKNSRIHISQVHDPHGGDEPEEKKKGRKGREQKDPKQTDSQVTGEQVAAEQVAGEQVAGEQVAGEQVAVTPATESPATESPSSEPPPTEPPVAAEQVTAETVAAAPAPETSTPEPAAPPPVDPSPSDPVSADPSPVDPSPAAPVPAPPKHPQNKPASPEVTDPTPVPVTKKTKKVSPRQRRRRWLVGVLKPLQGKRLPPSKLSSFQIVMLARALRSQVAVCSFEYDAKKLVDEIQRSAMGLNRQLEAKLRETVLIHEANIREAAESAWWDELQEQASARLVGIAADNLRRSVNRGGVDAKVVMSIDAVGPRTAATAIVSSDGRVLHHEDIPCQLSKSLRSQAVLKMGELIHTYGVDLIVVSNGPARRASLAAIGDLIEQSPEQSIRWTLADRNGADAYASGPVADQEMKATPRRFRAASWIAFSVVTPAQALAKVDPLKLRLGSFQRELSDDTLSGALRDVMISGASRGGIDANGAPVTWLSRLPGMNEAIAKAIDQRRREKLFGSRTELTELDVWDSLVSSRQALPFLRVFGSPQPLDGTMIHPDDYGLAEKLAKALELELPPAEPPGYTAPSFDDEPSEQPVEPVETPVADDSLKVETFETVPDEKTENFAAKIESESDAAPEAEATGESEPTADADSPAEAADTPADPDAASESAPEASADAEASDAPPPEASADAGDDATAETSADADATPESDAEPDAESDSAADAQPATPFRQALPEPAKVDKCVKEWQVGRHRSHQIVHWLCDPFGDSDPSGVSPAVLNTMPSLKSLKEGDEVIGVVVGVMPFGVFVELAPDCSGLIHVSRISEGFVEDLHEAVQVGDVITGWVTGIDEKRRRVALSAISPQRVIELDQERQQQHGRRDDRGPRGGGGGGQRRGGGQAGGQKGGGNRGGSERGRGGDNRGGGGGRSSDNRGGGRGRGGGRPGGRDRGRSRDRKPEVYRVTSSEPEKAPITDAMKQGAEPLRSFGDLMQFYQKDTPEPPKPEVKPDAPAPAAPEAVASDAAATTQPPSDSQAPADSQPPAASSERVDPPAADPAPPANQPPGDDAATEKATSPAATTDPTSPNNPSDSSSA
ncbi:S1 RNA-binding domain-containing protein [Crateriforma conspicua]|uniref:General stress protein 13 n=1 Tax=Crateriforma conspicua TaxID=2527996 RepID=A0A5C5Y574_9PLAN|nr:Tex-like N-terminal domain-containing protein [Crateriforma conspicua]TWT68562.1 General stress protein 13 [Crateriforma conspicua]